MRLEYPLIFALLLFAMSGFPVRAADKQEDIQKAMRVVQKIYAYGASHKWAAIHSDAPVAAFIGVLNQPRELEKCAVLCMTIASPMEAGEGGFDNYFYAGYEACVSKLSTIKGPEAADALKTIEWAIHADGGERELLDDAIVRQKKL